MNNFKKILIIGGAGYVGSELVKFLLNKNYNITVYDLMIYGNNIPDHKNLKIIKGDIRDINKLNSIMTDIDVVIHLACISNDPSFDLDPKLGKEINFDSFEPTVVSSRNNGVKLFIYASSSSVYGIKDDLNINEEMALNPITDYSKFKAQCEKVLMSYNSENFNTVILRPATVCGYSSRQRLDLVVNILTNFAYHKRSIKVFGGEQLRPNIHIKDMVHSYYHILISDLKVTNSKIYNVGFQNNKVKDIAKLIKKSIGEDVKYEFVKTNDERSYHISSEKFEKETGFKAMRSIEDAANDLKYAFDNKTLINTFENSNFFNIRKMQEIKLK